MRKKGAWRQDLLLLACAAFLVVMITGFSNVTMFLSYPQVLLFFLLGMAVGAPAWPSGAQ